jgi:hypothetical protein
VPQFGPRPWGKGCRSPKADGFRHLRGQHTGAITVSRRLVFSPPECGVCQKSAPRKRLRVRFPPALFCCIEQSSLPNSRREIRRMGRGGQPMGRRPSGAAPKSRHHGTSREVTAVRVIQTRALANRRLGRIAGDWLRLGGPGWPYGGQSGSNCVWNGPKRAVFPVGGGAKAHGSGGDRLGLAGAWSEAHAGQEGHDALQIQG